MSRVRHGPRRPNADRGNRIPTTRSTGHTPPRHCWTCDKGAIRGDGEDCPTRRTLWRVCRSRLPGSLRPFRLALPCQRARMMLERHVPCPPDDSTSLHVCPKRALPDSTTFSAHAGPSMSSCCSSRRLDAGLTRRKKALPGSRRRPSVRPMRVCWSNSTKML